MPHEQSTKPQQQQQSDLFSRIKKSIEGMDEEQLTTVQNFMTPDFANVMGMLFGGQLAQELQPLVDPSKQLVPIPTQAMKFLGEEKFNNFVTKALEGAQESKQAQKQAFVQQQQNQASPKAPAPAPAQNQSTAPTGLLNRPKPQLPIPQGSRSDQTTVPPIA